MPGSANAPFAFPSTPLSFPSSQSRHNSYLEDSPEFPASLLASSDPIYFSPYTQAPTSKTVPLGTVHNRPVLESWNNSIGTQSVRIYPRFVILTLTATLNLLGSKSTIPEMYNKHTIRLYRNFHQ